MLVRLGARPTPQSKQCCQGAQSCPARPAIPVAVTSSPVYVNNLFVSGGFRSGWFLVSSVGATLLVSPIHVL